MINGLDLFSGIGGISYALREWVEPLAYCERDKYAQAVLLSRMSEGNLTKAPIWDDIRTLDGTPLRDHVDIIYGGFPCQDLSTAGLREGLEAERSGLFFEIIRLSEEIKPTFIFLENVSGIRPYLGLVGKEMAKIGYDCRWDMLSAFDVGAPHKRERWFCLARSRNRTAGTFHTNAKNVSGKAQRKSKGRAQVESVARTIRKNVPNAPGLRLPRPHRQEMSPGPQQPQAAGSGHWEFEPAVGRVVNGLPLRRDRIKALGNSVVPQQVKEAFERLMGI